ncbi:Asp-tRNA(Asn)/Glu-tRNA(Gln) amidotransferase subunit GatC [Mycobacterium sp. DL592]|uniref:Asp-tRNA(Asn)/Glu-tRNA(Gln) amidotransferase subunit GatC n=1 Tax=Mycobacterium sp. DL592 TaxID=2675524 RepID=UPI00142114D0|nr:Asp-tRNA(Asn)/Glu-tRNA(Gln) amidotransferase subunit GatC [Mycobacterium sp. DL592]
MSQISRDEVARLAKLARLALTDHEVDNFAGQLDAILGYVSQIQAVDVTDVSPTGNPFGRRAGAQRPGDTRVVNVTRADVVDTCLTQSEALAEAPAAIEGRFAVPQILGEAE